MKFYRNSIFFIPIDTIKYQDMKYHAQIIKIIFFPFFKYWRLYNEILIYLSLYIN